jgi:hypothetical protein
LVAGGGFENGGGRASEAACPCSVGLPVKKKPLGKATPRRARPSDSLTQLMSGASPALLINKAQTHHLHRVSEQHQVQPSARVERSYLKSVRKPCSAADPWNAPAPVVRAPGDDDGPRARGVPRPPGGLRTRLPPAPGLGRRARRRGLCALRDCGLRGPARGAGLRALGRRLGHRT